MLKKPGKKNTLPLHVHIHVHISTAEIYLTLMHPLHNIANIHVPFSLIRGVRSLSLLSFPYSEQGISGFVDGVLQASFVTNSKFVTH